MITHQSLAAHVVNQCRNMGTWDYYAQCNAVMDAMEASVATFLSTKAAKVCDTLKFASCVRP